MAFQNIDQNHKPVLGSLYCADPNCEYCRELRVTIERVRNKEDTKQPDKQSAA
jgi:hypothetical protein